MDRKTVVMWAVAAALIIGVGALMFIPAESGAQDVSAQRAAELVAEKIRVIDVRTSGEFEAGHIPGAENVPVNRLSEEAAGWDLAEPLLIYCATGARSADAVRILSGAGFETIYHLSAGIIAWQGDVSQGADTAGSPARELPDQVPGDTPVLYVFSTDW